MAYIVCKWLNEELQLSKVIEPQSIAQDFSSGYLIGEVLHKYELQDDFSLFLKKDTSVAKLNNFYRLEPTLQLLGIPFNMNATQELMQEKPGAATSLLYRLHDSLEKMKKAIISRTKMEVMQPAAIAALHKKQHEMYRHGLKRDAEIIEQKMFSQCQSLNNWSVIPPIQKKRQLKVQNVQSLKNNETNRDCLMTASLPPPPRPPTLEKPIASTPTITQLESLYKHLCIVAPSGFISSPEFLNLLKHIISVNWARNTLPEPWNKLNETQLILIVDLLADDYGLIDWRRFLLSAALPWPIPSLMQLLVVLQHFKAADTGDTGFINEEQYLQSELWFSNESAPPVPEDPFKPLPYDRLANLLKFFFQLFADHSFSPPRLDYVSMLQYFAADTNPKQGFIRALSVELGQHLKHSSPGHLVKSMPSIEEATELSSSELDGEYKGEEAPCTSSSFLGDQKVSISALLAVLCHKGNKIKDDYLPSGCLTKEKRSEMHLVHIFRELGYKPEDCVPFSVLCQHPFTQTLIGTSKQHQLVNIHRVLLPRQDEGEGRMKEKSQDEGEESIPLSL